MQVLFIKHRLSAEVFVWLGETFWKVEAMLFRCFCFFSSTKKMVSFFFEGEFGKEPKALSRDY